MAQTKTTTPSRIAAGGGIVTRLDRNTGRMETLLVLTSGAAGYWGFPKGVAAEGEDLLDAAVRGVREMTGLQMVAREAKQTWRTAYSPAPGVSKTVSHFWLEPIAPTAPFKLKRKKVAAAAWVDFIIADLYLTYAEDRDAYRQFLEFRRAVRKAKRPGTK